MDSGGNFLRVPPPLHDSHFGRRLTGGQGALDRLAGQVRCQAVDEWVVEEGKVGEPALRPCDQNGLY
jgi:hypothetical protein